LIGKTVRLKEVAEIIAGQSPSGDNYNKEGHGTPFYQGKKDYGEKYLNTPTVWTHKVTKLAHKNDIILSVRAPVGALNISTQEICIGRGLAAIRVKKGVLNDYLYYFLMATADKLNSKVGAIFNSINKKQIEDIILPLPSLAEQQQIVAKLDASFSEIDKAIELTKKSISNFKSYYAYTIDKEFFKYSDKLRQIGDYSKINYGYTAKASFDKGSYKLLRITDIQNSSVNWNTVPYCNVEPNKLSRVILKHGDIVFARTGATTGKSFLIQNPVNSVFASYLIRISVDREILLPTFVIYYFQSAKYWKQVNDGISGSAQGGFNSSKLSQLRIPIISKTNQQKLVEKFDLINEYSLKLQDYYSRKLIHLHSLKQAILSKELIRKKAA